jgi:hypothetical protein
VLGTGRGTTKLEVAGMGGAGALTLVVVRWPIWRRPSTWTTRSSANWLEGGLKRCGSRDDQGKKTPQPMKKKTNDFKGCVLFRNRGVWFQTERNRNTLSSWIITGRGCLWGKFGHPASAETNDIHLISRTKRLTRPAAAAALFLAAASALRRGSPSRPPRRHPTAIARRRACRSALGRAVVRTGRCP